MGILLESYGNFMGFLWDFYGIFYGNFIEQMIQVIMRTFIKQTRTIFHEFLIVQITTDLGGVKFLSRIFSLTPPI